MNAAAPAAELTVNLPVWSDMARNSDRWVTPGVVIVGILTVGGVVLGVAALVAYLAARGIDPDPLMRLVAQVATGASALGGLVLQLLNRKTTAKAERNSGVAAARTADLADAVADVHDAVAAVAVPPGYGDPYTRELLRPPVPPAQPRHGAAPAGAE